MTDICLYSDKDKDSLLELISNSDSTPRTRSSWEGNQMTAILAWDNQKLIGALPLEKRVFHIGNNLNINLLWISAAHVEPEYRSKGIGNKMIRFIRSKLNNEFDAICAYREDDKSRAYDWYIKMGFHSILSIFAYKKQVNDNRFNEEKTLILDSISRIEEYSDALCSCYTKSLGGYGGFKKRNSSHWSHLVNYHYYKELYDYKIIGIVNDLKELDAFALLGETDMKDGVRRFDILECVSVSEKYGKLMREAIESYATEQNINEVRFQVADNESIIKNLQDENYQYRNRKTNILAHLINPAGFIKRCYENSKLDELPGLNIETPGYKNIIVKGNATNLTLFMDDHYLHKLLFNRLDVMDALNQGNISLSNGKEESLLIISQIFCNSPWRYFQSDYI